ncbi:MAG: hypothetical protein U0667_10985 [Chloroflexota bacterium]
MQRPWFLMVLLVLVIGVAAPSLAASPVEKPGDLPRTGRVLIVAGGDIDVPAGDQADALVVMGGDARVGGTVNAVVMVSGTVTTSSEATIGTIVLVGGTANLAPGTTVVGDVAQVGSSVVEDGGVSIGGQRIDLAGGLATLGAFLGVMAILAWVGVGLAALVGAMVLASLAGRQLRTAAWAMGVDFGMSILMGVLSLVIIPIVAVLAMATVIGIPTGLAILLVAWPALAFVGYLVAAIRIGDWLLGHRAGYHPTGRPHLAAFVGLLACLVLGLLPLVSAVISIVGTGAVLLSLWHTWRGDRPVGMAGAQQRAMPA